MDRITANFIVLLFGYLMLWNPLLQAQENIAVGSWRSHYSYQDARMLAVGQSSILSASSSGLFMLLQDDGSLERYSKINGLSGNAFTALHYHLPSNQFVIGYENGAFDLLSRQGAINNVRSLQNADIIVSKAIRKILTYQNQLLLLGEFGVLLYDVSSKRVIDEYRFLGRNGNSVQINDAALQGSQLFLATSEGLISADLAANFNLKDFRNWNRYEGVLPEASAFFVSASENFVVASFSGGLGFILSAGNWQSIDLAEIDKGVDIHLSGQQLWLLKEGEILIYDLIEEASQTITNPLFESLHDLAFDQNGRILLADGINGLLVEQNNAQFESIFPNGPFFNKAQELKHINAWLFAVPEKSYQMGKMGAGFAIFRNGKWENFSASGKAKSSPLPIEEPIVSFNTKGLDYYFLTEVGSLLKWDGADNFELIENSNSAFQFVALASFDNRLFAATSSNSSLHALLEWDEANKEWVSIDLSIPLPAAVVDMSIGADGLIILQLSNNGIIVHNIGSGESVWLNSNNNQGGFAGNRVLSHVRDLENRLWIGSDNGSFFVRSPIAAFEGSVNAVLPVFEGFFLLRGFSVFSLAVDAGNRKWMATQSGLWLFNQNGESQERFFDVSNSPMTQNRIDAMSINQLSGELFLTSNSGMVSYRSDATEAPLQASGLKVFPNPAYLSRHEFVAIEGAAYGSEVKITDMSGKLVWRGKSQGGTASWNMTDYQGGRPSAGVYLVFVGSAEQFSLSGKFLILP